MKVLKLEFNKIAIDQKFHCNGIDYIKKSSRTGHCMKYDKTFYFGQNEIVYNVNFYTDIKAK